MAHQVDEANQGQAAQNGAEADLGHVIAENEVHDHEIDDGLEQDQVEKLTPQVRLHDQAYQTASTCPTC